MLSIAVIEDNAEYAAMLEERIRKEFVLGEQISVDLYFEPADFLKELEKGRRYRLCFLDIMMPGMNGLELAEKIRETEAGALLVFLSSYSEYALEGYQVEAFDYLLKDKLEQQWARLVKRVAKRLADDREKVYRVRTQNRVEVIPISSIVYIYKEGKYCHFVMENNREGAAVRKTIREVGEEILLHKNFLQVKRGYLINMEKIRKYTAEEVIMKNGDRITIGRIHVARVKEAVMKYMEEL